MEAHSQVWGSYKDTQVQISQGGTWAGDVTGIKGRMSHEPTWVLWSLSGGLGRGVSEQGRCKAGQLTAMGSLCAAAATACQGCPLGLHSVPNNGNCSGTRGRE